MEKHAREVAALLGSGLAAAWMFGLGFGATSWLVWMTLGASIVAFAGLGPAAMEGEPGVATWPFVGLLLLGCGLFALAVGATRWLTWSAFGFGAAFVILSTVVTTAGSHLALPHHGHSHGSA
jgi:hypothetical protein